MRLINFSLTCLIITLFSISGFAQVNCSEIYEAPHPLELIYEEGPMGTLDLVKRDLQEAKSLTEANHAIHNIVVMSNRVMDLAIDNIIQMNFMEISPLAKSVKSEVVGHLIEQLQQTFGIGNNAMEAAINNRMNIEVSELQAKSEAAQTRRAIGFGRDESSESFHSEVVESRPVGFGETPRHVREKEMEEIRIKEMEESIREMVEFEEPAAPEAMDPIGFLPPKAEVEAPTVRQPIGFITRKAEPDVNDPAKQDQVVFNIETGSFELVKNQDH